MKSSYGYILLLVLLLNSCDSAGLSACQLVTDEVYTNTAPYPITEGLNTFTAALFEFQQTVKTYETGNCEKPAQDVDEVKLIIRNVTDCMVELEYNGSVILGRDGWNYEGVASLSPQGVVDEGVIQRGGIRIDGAQIILRGMGTRSDCR